MTRALGAPRPTSTRPTLARRPAGRWDAGVSGDPHWYKDAVIYEVRTRSFYDSNGDGVGDLQGLTSKLDYLADLGVTTVWVLPHYPSPGRDDGYDIADYTDVHPDVGTLDDFDQLIEQAHRRGLRVITELVLNHTSDQHPWFQRARRAPPGSPERDFYVWSDSADRYAEARIIFRDFEPSNWAWDPVAKAYFWHRFFAHQPDLNFENPAVEAALFDVVDFWLARGVDGLRLDAVPYLYEAEGTNCENLPATHAFLKRLRAHVDAKFPNRMLLAEANQWPEDAAAYFGDGDECHMNFHFPIMPRLFMSIHMEDRFPIIDILRQTPELHPSCQWAMFLRNHDELTLEMVTDEERDYMYRVYAHEAQMRINLGIRRRLAPLTGNDRRRMELLNGLLFSMPGTPVLYYGDEIGMGDNVYLGDRNGVRTPMQWSADRNAGFSRANPQKMILPIIIDPEYHYEALNVEAQQSNPNSLLWWTKRLIALRKRFQAFGRGSIEFLHPSNPRVLAFVRRWENELILVVANLSRHVQYVELDLSALKGMVPVELMGLTRFPTVGDLPYLLTLGGHDFYWFSLEAPRHVTQEERMQSFAPVALRCTSADEVLFGAERGALEEILPVYLEARDFIHGSGSTARITEMVRIPRGDEPPLVLAFIRAEYNEGEAETFLLPLIVVGAGATALGSIVAQLHFGDAKDGDALLVEPTAEIAGQVLLDAVARGASFRGENGKVVTGIVPGGEVSPGPRDLRILSSDRLGVIVAHGDQALQLYYRMEEGTAPELEIGRHLQAKATVAPLPRVTAFIEYQAPRSEPITLGVVETLEQDEGTAWQHARSELGRAYERILAQAPDLSPPEVPRTPLVELAYVDPPPEHAEMIGTYRDWAALLGRRVAELHLALASSTEPAFEPQAYSAMDQRSKYQTARNLVGRVLATMRRSLADMPLETRPLASQVLAAEDEILARFEPLLTQRIDAKQIRVHGDLHLGVAQFTGKDFVVVNLGGGRDRRLSERRRKAGVLRDVAGMLRSFHYATATSIPALRAEDQVRAQPWGWAWQQWASAAFLRGYLETANGAPFLSKRADIVSLLLDTALLEKAFAELGSELRRRPEMAWIPLQGIARMLG
ncbi:MAG: maltose alpha-D-glucosyltransferase [Labilithrix sp.]|nr:maltose alpha-D-glucosyltransferase [Labilithrix sp.]